MIKAGDKVICINSDYDEYDILAELPCEVGDICEIHSVSTTTPLGEVFMFKGLWEFDISMFYKYFIPIAEWREQQIKSVLDD